MFKTDQKKFYRKMNEQCSTTEEGPDQQHVEQFWSEIFEKEHHNGAAEWIQNEKRKYSALEPEEWEDLTNDDMIEILKHIQNWKSPGPDKVQNFWIKQLTSLHPHLLRAMNDLIKHPEKMPPWLTMGYTILLYKGKDAKDPKNFRPIACLPTLYKVITSALTNRIY